MDVWSKFRARKPQHSLTSQSKEATMVEIKMSNPASLGKPLGPYCQVSRVKASELVFIAGQTATDKDGKIVGAGDLDAQCRQVFANIEAALQSVRSEERRVGK